MYNYPTVGWEYQWFPNELYSILDLTMGIILGFFIPIQVRQRNYDCQSRLLATGVELIDWGRFYDGPFDTTNMLSLASYALKAVRDIWMIVTSLDVCITQLEFAKVNHFPLEFATKGKYIHMMNIKNFAVKMKN